MLVLSISVGCEEKVEITYENRTNGILVRVPAATMSIAVSQCMEIAEYGVAHGCPFSASTLRHVLACNERLAGLDKDTRIWDVLTPSQEATEAWINEALANQPELDPLDRWLCGPNFGLAAGYIAFRLTGRQPAAEAPITSAYPCDSDSLARCESLLNAVPELRTRLPELRSDPHWSYYVDRWAKLTEMIDTDPDTLDVLLRMMGPQEREVVQEIDGAEVSWPVRLLDVVFPGIDAEAALSAAQADPNSHKFKVR